jgi:hypothetical protein
MPQCWVMVATTSRCNVLQRPEVIYRYLQHLEGEGWGSRAPSCNFSRSGLVTFFQVPPGVNLTDSVCSSKPTREAGEGSWGGAGPAQQPHMGKCVCSHPGLCASCPLQLGEGCVPLLVWGLGGRLLPGSRGGLYGSRTSSWLGAGRFHLACWGGG